MQTAEVSVIRLCQRRYFEKDINALCSGKSVSKQSNIYKLDPFLEKKEILWAGGRIIKSTLEYKLKHFVLLPRKDHITLVIMRYYHEKVAHIGRGITINELRSQGYWIINCTSAAKPMISKFVDCRRFREKFSSKILVTCHQIDLPRNHFLPIVVSICLGHICLKMVVNKENTMVQCYIYVHQSSACWNYKQHEYW